MTKQGQESINRKISNLENRDRPGNFNVFYERVNRITSRDYNPIFDTDFASLVRYDRFPSLLYGSGATFLKIGLWYGGAASSFILMFSVYFLLFDKLLLDLFLFGSCSILRQYAFVKIIVGETKIIPTLVRFLVGS